MGCQIDLGVLPSLGLRVVAIDGGAVRTYLDMEFAVGGNPGRYPDMIPEDELWIEAGLDVADAAARIVHEAVEHILLANGIGYEKAHQQANESEAPLRETLAGRDIEGVDPVELADAWLEQM